MLHKSARFILTALLALSLCPTLAFADDSGQAEGSGNPLADLLYMVVGPGSSRDAASSNNGSSLYPNSLMVPPATTELPDCSAASDYVNGGLLIGASGNLYYLREVTFSEEGADDVYAYRTFERYNIGSNSWTTLESLPVWLEYCSVTLFDGVIVVSGATMTTQEDIPAHSDSPEQRVYSYNPKSDTPGWSEYSYSGVPVGASIVNCGGTLKAVGGVEGGSPSTAIRGYEPSAGVKELEGSLAFGAVAPRVVPHNESMYVYSFGDSVQDARSGSGSPKLQRFADGSATNLSSSLPSLKGGVGTSGLSTEADPSGIPSDRAAQYGGLSSSVEGLVLAAPASQSNSADTYVMGWDDGAFAAYDLRADSDALFGTSSCVYLGNLYALGSSLDEAGDPSLVFRSTPMKDAVLISGNNGVWRQGSDQGLQFVFSPDYGRFAGKVVVDDQELSIGRDYSASMGPNGTTITLTTEFLSHLSMGKHSISAFFDDGFTEIPASFTIETEASSIAEGYTRPASLAMTSDAIPIVPVVAGSLIALGALVVAFRKIASRS